MSPRVASHPDRVAVPLRAFLRDRLSPYKMPAEIRVVTHLPAAPSGKILKAKLREQLAAGNK
jgi:acyl-CoA synthetase (AMP-forming)/AMP-acid ligase II